MPGLVRCGIKLHSTCRTFDTQSQNNVQSVMRHMHTQAFVKWLKKHIFANIEIKAYFPTKNITSRYISREERQTGLEFLTVALAKGRQLSYTKQFNVLHTRK